MTVLATHRALQQLSGPLRTRNRAGWAAVAIGAVALLLGLAAWAVKLGWVNAPYWVLVAWTLALLAVAVVVYQAWAAQSRLSAREWQAAWKSWAPGGGEA